MDSYHDPDLATQTALNDRSKQGKGSHNGGESCRNGAIPKGGATHPAAGLVTNGSAPGVDLDSVEGLRGLREQSFDNIGVGLLGNSSCSTTNTLKAE